MIKYIDNENEILVNKNIPQLLKEYSLSRYELHKVFSEYKVLEKVTNEKYPSHNGNSRKGLDYHSYTNGVGPAQQRA